MSTPSGIIPDTDEIQLLPASVAKIANSYGHRYYRERSKLPDGRTDELWAERAWSGVRSGRRCGVYPNV